jgi:NDP-sugar pyrophosphorylase family protein
LLGECETEQASMMATAGFPGAGKSSVTAVILSGGRGERLRPLTDTVPKPLLPVNGRPLLDYLLDHLGRSGIDDMILCVGYKAELFAQFALGRTTGPKRIRCLDSGDSGITERLALARPLIAGQALVCYADTLADVNIEALLEAHHQSGAEATITVYPYHSPFGLVTFDDQNRVCRFEEKPSLPYWINIGFLLLEPAALRRLRAEVPLPEYLTELVSRRTLNVHRHLGRHWTANTETELRTLAAELRAHTEHQRIRSNSP